MTIRLMKHYVTNGEVKARVWYSRGALIDGRDCVTIYAKDYTGALGRVFAGDPHFRDESDPMTDYFERGLVRVFPSSPLWDEACARATR